MDIINQWWTKLYFLLLRPLYKLIFRWISGKCELLRITYSNSSQGDMVNNIESSLLQSRNVELKKCAVSTDLDVAESTERIRVVKNINLESHPRFKISLQDSLLRIVSYNKLIQSAESRRQIKFSSENEDHMRKLEKLWDLYNSGRPLPSLVGSHWTEIGFQGDNPATDFRGMGLLGLEQLMFFSEIYPEQAQKVLNLSHHPNYGFSFAIVGINITEMCLTLLIKRRLKSYFYSIEKPSPGLHDFHSVYCHIFNSFQQHWIAERPKDIMEFGMVRQKYLQHLEIFLTSGDSCATLLTDFSQFELK
ncbi:Elmo domain-containing protein 2-like protein [Plakobranchus ocellatus]|uniref:Elmo domain-containing protein 2-like protein n=1 Tax=Plakobranchus ocellatus TaxID=259542 RepID=A0AAV3YCG9_9GAST|nr:Elmo domain-containing protein 2-like protein [Plakobranchus ocellatus]